MENNFHINNKCESSTNSYTCSIGVAAFLSICSPVFSNNNFESNSSDRKVHISLVKEYEVNKIINELDKINNSYINLNNNVMSLSKIIIEKLTYKGIKLDFVNPSNEGSILLEFHINKNYHLIELFNDGDIVLLKRHKNSKREVYDLDKESLIDIIENLA